MTRVAAAAVAGLLIWLFVAVNLFCFPPPARPGSADAVVLLGGASAERLPTALALFRELPGDPTLVLSTTDTAANAAADAMCREPEPGLKLVCFHPDPRNTRGEADALRRLTELHGWRSVIVVTSSYHVPRAGELLGQCLPARVRMVGTEPRLNTFQWLRRFVIESGGLLDVALRPECR
ncbi:MULTISPECIES: YdcF family protein [Arthrobacter]|uniref:YdcF family protein n=2 Tax=Arthrobacter TaxID=1663 RepID=A0ABU9KF80_9MICC|nr:YdcF family protein [Arthrobacter sp. YJM1]MDP5225545.1 YdcF family protein [Arthrobacter sp. YJM1]